MLFGMRLLLPLLATLITLSSAAPRFSPFAMQLVEEDTDVPPGCHYEETGPFCAEKCRVGHERERDLCDGSCCYQLLCCN
ncbi:hypothetical protein CPC08DRAFT_712235 [Agrocybe pediades]|nr:hypothetical protein CPC08DRAFT_712235 [Agrocybe pediades]